MQLTTALLDDDGLIVWRKVQDLSVSPALRGTPATWETSELVAALIDRLHLAYALEDPGQLPAGPPARCLCGHGAAVHDDDPADDHRCMIPSCGCMRWRARAGVL